MLTPRTPISGYRSNPGGNTVPTDNSGPPGTGGRMILPFDPKGGDHRGMVSGQGGMLSAYMPGQQMNIASQMAQGFGGGAGKWANILGQSYSDMRMPVPQYPEAPKKNKNHPGKDDPDNGHGHNNDGDPDINSGYHSHNEAGDAVMAQQRAMQMASMQAQPSAGMQQMGMQPPQAQQQMLGQQPGMQSQIPPQILQLLRQRAMMGGR